MDGGGAFHIMIEASALPENSRDPSPDKHTDHTLSVCPSSVCTHAPVDTSHTLIVLSSLPENSRDPSPDKHTDHTQSVCPLQRLHARARRHVPHLDRLVLNSPRTAATHRPTSTPKTPNACAPPASARTRPSTRPTP